MVVAVSKSSIKRRIAGVVSALMLVLFGSVSVFAVDDVPAQVMEARDGVMRIVTILNDGSVSSGTGFVVGTDKDYYIVTNHHVIEDGDMILGLYDTGKYTELTVYEDSPERDLCILKMHSNVPGIKVLPLATGSIDSGMAVYALGFPGASDVLAEGFDQFDYTTVEAFIKNLNASKQSMTVTNGIISAILDSKIVGTGTRSVKLIQTNTAINSGNSGGPLLDKAGNVVGINTLGLSAMGENIQAMNGSVHVEELTQLLRKTRITYNQTVNTTGTLTQADNGKSIEWFVGVTSIVLAFGVLFGFIILFNIKKRSRMGTKNAMTLTQYEQNNTRMNQITVNNMTLGFLNELLALGNGVDLNCLLTPENVIITPTKITLRRKKMSNRTNAKIDIYPGYSAPENFRNRAGAQSSVYFIGGMMFTLLTGQRTEDALTRQDKNTPVFYSPDILEGIINSALEPDEYKRIPSIYAFYTILGQNAPNIINQNSYRQMPQYPMNQGYWK